MCVTCKQCVHGNAEGGSGSDQIQAYEPVLSAVQVNVKIVLRVLDEFGCMHRQDSSQRGADLQQGHTMQC